LIDLLIDHYVRAGDSEARDIFVTTLDRMARGGVYDQLAGGFHRYSVDERWIVPHFEKMSYDNSELLKNYVHAAQVTGNRFFAHIARDIIRWMDEWLSDRKHAGFYASQDADYSMDDDGDYFTWTLDEAAAVLSEDELRVAQLHYDINEVGEMHHNSAKNVLYVRAAVEIAVRLGMPPDRVEALLASAREKLYAARRGRPTPFVDKTVYVSWNALCISAYFEAARVLQLDDARRFALRSLDRVLAEGWNDEGGLQHVIAYSEAGAEKPRVSGLLDDYAFTVLACLDAYEATSDLSYFHFAQRIADRMIARFFDEAAGGFFDAENTGAQDALGVLATRRKPFQDSPTPSGNSAAIMALLRLHAYTNDAVYREKAERTLRIFAGVAEQFGMFAATYAIAAVMFSQPHTQVVVIGSGQEADRLYRAALDSFSFTKVVLQFRDSELTPHNLPPALAQTLPAVPRPQAPAAVICSGFRCQAPVTDAEQLIELLREARG
jgi:uncharacterized protein YyaL (SSP411 family)